MADRESIAQNHPHLGIVLHARRRRRMWRWALASLAVLAGYLIATQTGA